MTRKSNEIPFDWRGALLQAYAVSEEMNQCLLKHLDERAWRAKPPGGKVRDIARVVAHMHHGRHMWLLTCGKDVPNLKIPSKLKPTRCTKKQAQAALEKSAQSMLRLIRAALERPGGRVKNFPSGVTGFIGYHIAHEAHHRGQVMMLARQLGYPFAREFNYTLWAPGRRRRT